MLFQYVALLNTRDIVLASASPRRVEILQSLGLRFEVVSSTFAETLDKSSFEDAGEYALATAGGKASEVAGRLASGGRLPDLVIAADSIVALDERILEKPAGRSEARAMMSALSGRANVVCTGVVLLFPASGAAPIRFVERTEVVFAPLSAELIESYLDLDDYADKAGGYGIQSAAGALISAIRGCYFNAMGFPKHRFCAELAAALAAEALAAEAAR